MRKFSFRKIYVRIIQCELTSKFLKESSFGDVKRPSILSPPIILILPSLLKADIDDKHLFLNESTHFWTERLVNINRKKIDA